MLFQARLLAQVAPEGAVAEAPGALPGVAPQPAARRVVEAPPRRLFLFVPKAFGHEAPGLREEVVAVLLRSAPGASKSAKCERLSRPLELPQGGDEPPTWTLKCGLELIDIQNRCW